MRELRDYLLALAGNTGNALDFEKKMAAAEILAQLEIAEALREIAKAINVTGRLR